MFSFRCSIFSNSEMLHLTWRVTIPGETINITYPNSRTDRVNLNNYISTIMLLILSGDDSINSTLRIVVNQYTPTHQIVIECSIANVEYRTISFHVNTSGK